MIDHRRYQSGDSEESLADKIKRIAIIIILILLIGLASYAVYKVIKSRMPQDLTPKIKVDFDKKAVTVQNNNISSDFVTLILTRQDSQNQDAVLTLKFPQNYTSVYAVNIDGERIKEIQTAPLRGKNAKTTVQFKVYGSTGEFDKVELNLQTELWWNNTKLPNHDVEVHVTVKSH